MRLQIFSAAFIAVFGLLQVQPVFFEMGITKDKSCAQPKKTCCAKTSKPSCSGSKCTPPKNSEKGKDCNNGCNPFVPCAVGSCCYLVESFYSYSSSSIVAKQKLALINDNRISSGLSECWHPPELIF